MLLDHAVSYSVHMTTDIGFIHRVQECFFSIMASPAKSVKTTIASQATKTLHNSSSKMALHFCNWYTWVAGATVSLIPESANLTPLWHINVERFCTASLIADFFRNLVMPIVQLPWSSYRSSMFIYWLPMSIWAGMAWIQAYGIQSGGKLSKALLWIFSCLFM